MSKENNFKTLNKKFPFRFFYFHFQIQGIFFMTPDYVSNKISANFSGNLYKYFKQYFIEILLN